MNQTINYAECRLVPMVAEFAHEISQWKYDPPYDMYSFQGQKDEFLMDSSIWGVEQFCLVYSNEIVGQAACQFEGERLWVGWSMRPDLCGKGHGFAFVKACVSQLRAVKNYEGNVLLRVAASNPRAIKAYQKAGFLYRETITDEVAFSNHMEDFWVMEMK